MNHQTQQLKLDFRAVFGQTPELLAQAPGRVNLIGEHTDYNDGFVLPCAINFKTVVAATRRNDRRIRVTALDYNNDTDEFDLAGDIGFVKDKMWPNYVRGVIVTLLQRGFDLGGVNLAITGDVPQGAGLSSSASLETALGTALNSLFELDISREEMAAIGQEAENNFVGCNCGIMDQTIAVRGQAGHAMLLDCRSLKEQHFAMPDTLDILIVNSNKQRGLVDSAYNERRAQCQAAADLFAVKALRDITPDKLRDNIDKLEPLVAKRARHVISENDRTQLAANALQENDIVELSLLMAASHRSMRDDFEITTPEIDSLVDIIQSNLGDQGGVRMTGGGFGGCVIALVPRTMTDAIITTVEEQYPLRTGLQADVYRCHSTAGAGLLDHSG